MSAPVARVDWQRRYARLLWATDTAAVGAAAALVQLWRFRSLDVDVAATTGFLFDEVSYTMVSVGIVLVWVLVLGFAGSRQPRVIGVGTVEYRVIVDWGVRLLGVAATVSFFAQLEIARAYLLLIFPIGILFLLVSRWLLRKWLRAKRDRGMYTLNVVLLGSRASIRHYINELRRHPWAGYRVIAACLPGATAFDSGEVDGVPVAGGFADVHRVLEVYGADTVLLAGADELTPQKVRELSWRLEAGRYHLVVAPNLTDIGGPRIHTRPVAGLPLIHVETPRYDGMKRYAKRAFDILFASILLILLAGPMLVIAMLINRDSPGGVLFRQERIGLDGRTFDMLKFRSMRSDAENVLVQLQDDGGRISNGGVLFKMKQDPRVTTVGRVLRRYSLDELPQLFNVLNGSMSLVGPRPPLAREVSQYDDHVHRRFLVTPGITGLWQVSGRSDLSWEDSVRLDLYYVENWSLTGDFVILWRTAKAVLRGSGAY